MVWIEFPDGPAVRKHFETIVKAREYAVDLLTYSPKKRVKIFKSLHDEREMGFVERYGANNQSYFMWVSFDKKSGTSQYAIYKNGKIQR